MGRRPNDSFLRRVSEAKNPRMIPFWRKGLSLVSCYCAKRTRMYRRSYKLLTRHSVLVHRVTDSVPYANHSFLRTPASQFLCFPHQTNPKLPLQLPTPSIRYSTHSASEVDVDKEVDMINLKFAEAREEIEMAMESKETVYFDEEAECARSAAKEVVEMFEGLLGKLPEDERAALQRSMGLKIEQLKAEIKQLDD